MINEVRPSTVETWLTIRREYSVRARSSHALDVVQRMRTPCAAYILARTMHKRRPTRPRRDLQSDPRCYPTAPPTPRSRAPPGSVLSIIFTTTLTGNSVERLLGAIDISRGNKQERHKSTLKVGCPLK